MDIFESVVRLYFDLLHGIKRMDVPLLMALEFAILLGFDGQLQQNSDMEKELFVAAIEQLKERFKNKVVNFCTGKLPALIVRQIQGTEFRFDFSIYEIRKPK